MKYRFFLSILGILFWNTGFTQNPLVELIHKNKTVFGDVFDRPNHYEVQIIYTQIDRDQDNIPHFTSHYYQLDSTNYYYPASTVKMPTAFAALEKLNQLNIKDLDKFTPMRNGVGSRPQTAANLDASAQNLSPSIAPVSYTHLTLPTTPYV